MGAANSKSGMVEAVVCREDEMKDGEMKIVEVGSVGRALLIKDKGEFHAVGTECSHYRAPLIKGAYCDGKVRCPWHGACFNVKTGDIEDFPGLDGIPKYQVEVANGEVKVRGNKALLKAGRIQDLPPCTDIQSDPTFLIIGGGGAAATCAETLRRGGFKGRIIMATKEDAPPYDRPKLSKAMDSSAEALALRKPSVYSQYCVEVLTDKEATGIDTSSKVVTFKDESTIRYDKVLIATGGSPRGLTIPGADLKNILLLRTPKDGNIINQEAKEKKVVIIGSSFIGLEVAGFLTGKAESVTVVGRSPVPLKSVLGDKVGIAIKKHLEEKGVQFVFNNPPAEFIGENGALSEVLLADGTKLPADVAVLGVGVYPTTDFLKNTPIDISPEGHVIVDKQMRTSVEGVYAAGDIVKFPLFMADDQHCNVQHWQMASMQGTIAARSMMDKGEDIHSVPFFWSAVAGKNLRFAGYNAGHDDVIIHGDLESYKFIAFYIKGDKVVAVATMNQDPVAAQAAEMFRTGKALTKKDIETDPTAWVDRLVCEMSCL